MFYDRATCELKRQVRLQDAYWFTAMAVYPDTCDPTVSISDVTLRAGQDTVVSMLDAVNDADNMDALAVSTAVSSNENVVRVEMSGLELHVTGLRLGSARVQVTADSNGKQATGSFIVIVKAAAGDVNMDGRVDINDVTKLINILLGSVLNDYDPSAADYNGNGIIDISDVTALINRILTGH